MESSPDDSRSRSRNTTRVADGPQARVFLRELKVGESAQIVGFLDNNDTIKKIEAMGLRAGKRVTILRKLGRGILVRTNNSRIVITSDVAKNIEVK